MVDELLIVMADDQKLRRQGLRDLLLAQDDFRIVREAGSGESAIAIAGQAQPDVILLDLEVPATQPIRAVEQLREASPWARLIILSAVDDGQLMRDMLTVGARGYLHKSVSCAELMVAIRSIYRGNRWVIVTASPERDMTARAPSEPLSSREREVLILVARALSNRQIGGRLSITEGTVKRHLRSIFGKLGAVSRIDAVNKARAAAQLSDGAGRRPALGGISR